MLELIRVWFEGKGVSGSAAVFLSWCLTAIGIVLLAYLSDLVARSILLRGLKAIIRRSQTNWDDVILKRKLFHRLSYFAPALVIYFFAPVFPDAQEWIQRLAASGIIIIGLLVFNSFLNSTIDIYNTYEISRERPIKGYIQIFMIFAYVLVGVYVIATLMNRSPWVLLSGIGAMTAILLLIFKDSILGLVAGFQLSANNMVRMGDWIEMPKFNADGDVIDISLNTVKVRNWDKTITTIPTYALISDSFKNWRGMEESGGRRIKRAVYIDMNSIRFCTDEMIDRFERFQHIADYIRKKKEEIARYNEEHNIDTSRRANSRNLTNLGTFRAYIVAYLKSHPRIHNDMTFLIRQLPPTQYGLPIEIYVFSNDQEWANYEAIQADIFDHILAVVPEFDLRVYQSPSGYDFRSLAGKVSE